jgi:hypothetical protein
MNKNGFEKLALIIAKVQALQLNALKQFVEDKRQANFRGSSLVI